MMIMIMMINMIITIVMIITMMIILMTIMTVVITIMIINIRRPWGGALLPPRVGPGRRQPQRAAQGLQRDAQTFAKTVLCSLCCILFVVFAYGSFLLYYCRCRRPPAASHPACRPACLPDFQPACLHATCLPACWLAGWPACLPAGLPAGLPAFLPACLPACQPASQPACHTKDGKSKALEVKTEMPPEGAQGWLPG